MYDEVSFRAKLGSRLVIFATIALVVLAAIVMSAAAYGSPGSIKDTAQLLFSSLLPLFGTWVGTVLALYYTKENFGSASRNTLDLVRSVSQRLASTKATDAMMPRTKMITLISLQAKC
jgi:uncharacterized membrane protein